MYKKTTAFVSIMILLALPILALAAQTPSEWFRQLLNNFMNIVLWPVFITASIACFMYAGFMYLTAHGDPTHISAAHKAVMYGIIGIVVALLGFSAVRTIQNLIPTTPAAAACTVAGGVCGTGNYNCCSGSCNDIPPANGVCQ